VFFVLIAFIITFCLSTYSKIIFTLEENAINKIQLEKSALEAEYTTQIDNKLQQLHTLRHDMKNHLLMIDSLSAEYKNEQIHDYISKISDELKLFHLHLPLYLLCLTLKNLYVMIQI